jgi:hypothetical protein
VRVVSKELHCLVGVVPTVRYGAYFVIIGVGDYLLYFYWDGGLGW